MFEIYTDGACEPNPGLGGWGFVVYQHGVEIHTAFGGEHNTTNNRMEFAGILNALLWLDGKKATIHTDSQYCLNALTIWHQKWALNGWRKGPKKTAEPVKNAEVIQACLAAKQSRHTLKWCKGHSGITGNERADRLAAMGRSGTKDLRSEPAAVAPVPATQPEPMALAPLSVSGRSILTLKKQTHGYLTDCGCDHIPPWEDCEHTLADGDREALRAQGDQIGLW